MHLITVQPVLVPVSVGLCYVFFAAGKCLSGLFPSSVPLHSALTIIKHRACMKIMKFFNMEIFGINYVTSVHD
jgi:hypothetical protein